MVKSETRRDAEILGRNPSPRLFGKKFRDSKKVKKNMQKRDFETYQKRFRDFEILPKFSETHVFRGTIRQPFFGYFGEFFSGILVYHYPHWPTLTTTMYNQGHLDKVDQLDDGKTTIHSKKVSS